MEKYCTNHDGPFLIVMVWGPRAVVAVTMTMAVAVAVAVEIVSFLSERPL